MNLSRVTLLVLLTVCCKLVKTKLFIFLHFSVSVGIFAEFTMRH